MLGCGSRTPLEIGAIPDATVDATKDATVDATKDATTDAIVLVVPGCADGTREAFRDDKKYPLIAGCSGGFTVAGLFTPQSSCNRVAGNDSANPNGQKCGPTDLCESGWHVCSGANEVAMKMGAGGCAPDAPQSTFFATSQSGPGCLFCSTGNDPSCNEESCRAGCLQTKLTTNDIFGCGTIGTPSTMSCGVLDRSSDNFCGQLPAPWSCPGNGEDEILTVTKAGSGAGGVLCCKD